MSTYYDERDIEAQGSYYTRHVSAMTAEELHSKMAIAAELAHRDMEIDELRQQLRESQARVADLEATLYHGNLEREKCQKAMILRKQAEAVEKTVGMDCDEAWDYAQELRTQADAAEKEGGGCE